MKLAKHHMDNQKPNCGNYSSECPVIASNGTNFGIQNLDWYPTAQEKDFPSSAPN